MSKTATRRPSLGHDEPPSAWAGPERFSSRHIGPGPEETREMLAFLGLSSLEALEKAVVPQGVRSSRGLNLPEALSEAQALARLRELGRMNQVWRSCIGMGYSDCLTPAPIQRHILENPGWYTAYTPYQAEIAQGRLEALLNFQTMVMDLTAMEVANASLLDEATAAAEAMALCFNVHEAQERPKAFFVSKGCHPQTEAVVRTRAEALGLEVVLGDPDRFDFSKKVFGVLLQYPQTDGSLRDDAAFCERAHAAGALVVVAADLLALTLLKAPGEFGADVAVGSTQRFGIPLWYGGPHAAYIATKDAFKRHLPGRIVGVSQDAEGRPALRLALQTREQHIRRERATSNICTAQVLPAVAAGFYAVYHGPEGLKRIARRVHALAGALAEGLRSLGIQVAAGPFFDTVKVELDAKRVNQVEAACARRKINLRRLDKRTLAVALDETTAEKDVEDILEAFTPAGKKSPRPTWPADQAGGDIPAQLRRTSAFLKAEVFHRYHSETELMRYIKRLESRDLSLTTAMIPLGSCTMKLNAASEMAALSWEGWARIHPFAPVEQAEGYQILIRDLETWLCEITGFAAFSLQPNAGSQGEYAGLLAIRRRHQRRGQGRRRICLIPQSAHGTNPASAAMAGLEIVSVACTTAGDIDLDDLRAKAAEHSADLAALMVTYPSTYGVFEEGIRAACEVVHSHGGLVYMDGANMNAQVGLCKPAEIGADICHLNLHKTFAIPHGGGGPGMGPIGVTRELAEFLPGSPVVKDAGTAIAAAPWGSAAILTISWAYIAQLGASGLRAATLTALLNANYVARRLEGHYPILFRGRGGFVAHECILDLRALKGETDVAVEDVAKRLMDYGFHAPTVSFPVAGTMMIEPTESESKAELDRFCEAMIRIREEIREIASGRADKADNVLKNSPHTAQGLAREPWDKPYSREKAVYPAPWTKEHKFWPSVARIDNAYGDRNFFCSCNAPASTPS